MANTVLGWDIGGAHVKAALVDEAGRAQTVQQVACPLWQGLDKLTAAINAICEGLPARPDMNAVTMTGELADIFPDRFHGVLRISGLLVDKLRNPRFYSGQKEFIAAHAVAGHAAGIASANWLASAQFLAQQVEGGLFMDLGSTTCDLVAMQAGTVINRGYSDAERMRHEELVYTGVVRTPLMAYGQRVLFDGEWCPLAAEHFATAADVYRLTGELGQEYDLAATADGAGKTPEESARRLARMICHDFGDAPPAQWNALAFAFRQMQLDRLKDAALRQFSQWSIPSAAPIVGAGVGSFLVRELARELNRDYLDSAEFVIADTPEITRAANVCFPAYAVARLALAASHEPH